MGVVRNSNGGHAHVVILQDSNSQDQPSEQRSSTEAVSVSQKLLYNTATNRPRQHASDHLHGSGKKDLLTIDYIQWNTLVRQDHPASDDCVES